MDRDFWTGMAWSAALSAPLYVTIAWLVFR